MPYCFIFASRAKLSVGREEKECVKNAAFLKKHAIFTNAIFLKFEKTCDFYKRNFFEIEGREARLSKNISENSKLRF